MKIIHRILVVLVVIASLSSCTQRRYSHITGFQLKKKADTEKAVYSGHYVTSNPGIVNVEDNDAELTPIDVSYDVVEQTVPPVSKEMTSSPFARKRVERWVEKSQVQEEYTANPVNVKNVAQALQPTNIAKKVSSKVAKKTKAGGLIYWILVLILLLLIIALLESILGTALTRILILIVVIAFLGHLLGLW